jgi:hypothetical protein
MYLCVSKIKAVGFTQQLDVILAPLNWFVGGVQFCLAWTLCTAPKSSVRSHSDECGQVVLCIYLVFQILKIRYIPPCLAKTWTLKNASVTALPTFKYQATMQPGSLHGISQHQAWQDGVRFNLPAEVWSPDVVLQWSTIKAVVVTFREYERRFSTFFIYRTQ